jgi:hypothetical protein
VSLDAARRDAVDADAVGCPLNGEAPGKLVHGTLGHGVDRYRREPDESRDGGHVHNAAAATEEERVRELREVEARLEVGRHDPPVVLAADLSCCLEQRLPRIVHLHVHTNHGVPFLELSRSRNY